ncbi:LbetaH domain-containing protein [Facklamia miroungae]|uniref:Acetyltransferase (Isoleucine patch superfamily) n=1 Tax=Facklamia miroungae TaxID=120956 RepID=A0A1G7PIE2_9LACT|nr:acetyltransferase [Facklamia miroungae]NKZ28721.1 acetyltransferase [Facklamia miroungae]SDF86007.1 Acetyltransferase (isoleucine patch superfamily) [Facklamia miroungae]
MRKSNYGFTEILKNIYNLFKTKLLFPNARLIRFPIIIRGKKYINFGNNLTTGYNCRIDVLGKHYSKILTFNNNINMGDNVRISCCEKINIGSNVLIGSRVLIIDNSHGTYDGNIQDNPFTSPNSRKLSTKEININDNVWIGEGVVVQKGCSIGKGSIIAANSVVTSDIPSQVIAGGIPAKILKIFDEELNEWRRV